MKFPRTIQLDGSDSHVYERLAVPGEWAVPASFAFLDIDPGEMTSKRRQAFGHGFLGTESFGWSTLVEVAEIDAVEYDAVVTGIVPGPPERKILETMQAKGDSTNGRH